MPNHMVLMCDHEVSSVYTYKGVRFTRPIMYKSAYISI